MQKHEKHYADAEKSHREVLDAWRHKFGESHPQTIRITYLLAGDQALDGKRDDAIHNLEFAFAHQIDPDLVKMFESDPDLQSLHDDPRFAALVEKAHQLAAAEK